MAKCKICGKRGLLLWVSPDGRCRECQTKYEQEHVELKRRQEQERVELERKEKEGIEKAEKYLQNIKNTYAEMFSDIDTDIEDPIELLKVLPMISEKEKQCDCIIESLKDYGEYKYLEKVILNSAVFESKNDEIMKCGYIKELGQYVWIEHFDINSFFSELTQKVKKCKNAWWKVSWRIRSNADFERTLSSIEHYPFTISNNTVKRQYVKGMPELKFSNITSRSNYDHLGTFVIVDVETTGLDCGTCRIIEFSALRFENWKPIEAFQTLIQPNCSIPYKIRTLTGINDDMVKDAPTFSSIVPSALEFIGKYNIVGHNLGFDIKFLYAGGLDVFSSKRRYYDTLELSRHTFKDVDNYKLETLCNYFDIRDNKNSHRALSDCLATGYLFHKIVSRRTH